MIKINAEKMQISLTRGDSATIEFSAKDEDGEIYEAQTGDELVFAVSKKYGGEHLFEVVNKYDLNPDDFWNIEITPEMTKNMKFSDYYWDIQLTTPDGVSTIIGQTDTLEPIFTVWGEVA